MFEINRCRLAILCVLFWSMFSRVVYGQDDAPLPGVTVQIPTLGVAIDANGVLAAKVFPDPTGQLNRQRLQAAHQNLPRALHRRCACRKVSLRKLEAALVKRIDAGQSPTAAMNAIAGLTQIEFVFVLPAQNDIVIAGPAEPWVENLAGRFVGAATGKPTLLLENWVNALRFYLPDVRRNDWIACSIDPTSQGLERLKAFQTSLPRSIAPQLKLSAASELTERLRNSLGESDVNVYGIDPQTRGAQIMIEADYRMKAIAIGLEMAPTDIKTFIQALKGAPKHFQRWWLTPDYRCLQETEDRLAVQMIGQGVKLQTETITFDDRAAIQSSNLKPSRAARTFAKSFTENYVRLARNRPVFAQLRNVIDCFVLAAWLQSRDAYTKSNWRPELLLDESRLPVANHQAIKKAQSLANGLWKKNMLLLPSGGVSIRPTIALQAGNIATVEDNQLGMRRQAIEVDMDSWWWD